MSWAEALVTIASMAAVVAMVWITQRRQDR